ncbi:MAG TPA: phosphoribosylamine--glycine ligase [Candidatus Faecivivens stercoripullorum]|uniref:Phosphoribosylamine--glycine ligase n=1 Tax=Candidatus Faecivivens stercoripullorum TaxID=2840805 RepID=A0A9D1H7B0_9FIRM|nr:phosphoribosylamine--glycine ligase [Candidatus Faecivivens stercoripullorum]
MKVLVIGSGGREHAIVLGLLKSPKVTELWCAPGNGGISAVAHTAPINVMDKEGMVAFAKEKGIEFAVVAPDDPLAAGMADAMEEAGIPAFGPSAKAAQIEASKVFSKNLMKKYGIPTAAYETFEDEDAAIAYLKAQNSYPAVIKADGLALGKGVIIAADEAEAVEAVHEMMSEGKFGDSGRRVVIEEFLTGPEVSVLSFTDGKTVVPMISSKDHKRANDNDEGLNTGGMGTIAPNPFYTPEIAAECMEKIFLPTIDAMNKEGRTFKGCLYFGLMITPKGPKVIEYNCRFGDPETQVVLPLLKSDLLEIMMAVQAGRLSEVPVEFSDETAACVVMASGGYPVKYQSGYEITGLDEKGQAEGVTVYHAGTKLVDGKFITAGGRVLGVTATGKTLDEALSRAYAGVEKIHFTDVHYRHDIGRTK